MASDDDWIANLNLNAAQRAAVANLTTNIVGGGGVVVLSEWVSKHVV